MTIDAFKRLLESNNAIKLNEDFILFNDLELYNMKTGEETQFSDYEEMAAFPFDGETLGGFIEKQEAFYVDYKGGRGASSLSGKMGGGFTSAGNDGSGGFRNAKFPAEFNVGGRYRSYDKTLNLFQKKYAGADHEYGIAVDSDGFVYRHIEGGRSSVAISGGKGQMILHNHPSGGNFSKADMVNISMGNEKGIVAVGNKHTYTMTKGKNFKPKAFIKAVNKAQWPIEYDYDKGADWWLRKNQKKYGYTYKKTATKK